MKKLLLAILGIASIGSAYSQLLNPGFEKLRTDGKPANWGSIVLLPFVDSSTPCIVDSAFYFASKDAHNGKFALEMRNASCNGIYLGTARAMSTDTTYFAAGVPFTDRPGYFTFWYKFKSVGNDTAVAHIWMYNDNSSNTVIDQWISLSASSSYKPVSVSLNYLEPESPSFVEITFATESDRSRAHYGSQLIVDDLEMRNFPLAAVKLSAALVKCYPNPVKDEVHFEVLENSNYQLQVFNLAGALIHNAPFSGNYTLPCGQLTASLYFYSITDAQGAKISGKFSVD